MNATASLSATDRFTRVIDGLCRAVAARIAARTMTGALITLIWRRLRRFDTELQALVARMRSGTLRIAPTAPRHTARRRSPILPSLRLPRHFAWLLPLVPYEAACFAGQMRVVLEDPEMVALIAATPRASRILRPLCRMLGLEASLLVSPVDIASVDTMEAGTETTNGGTLRDRTHERAGPDGTAVLAGPLPADADPGSGLPVPT